MKSLKPGLTYFAIIFGVGFALGTIRVLLVAPRVSVRRAELLEEPILFVPVSLTARRLVRRFTISTLRERLGAEMIGLGLLLMAEYALLRAQGLTLRHDIVRRDPVASTVYLLALLLFAMMPALVGKIRPNP